MSIPDGQQPSLAMSSNTDAKDFGKRKASADDAEDEPGTSMSTEDATGSDDFQDNQSVMSDMLSLSQRSQRKGDARKLMGIIQRLKTENLSLRETISASNVQDVGILRTKLRGANADIVRLKQSNAELRERIQGLEQKLFELASPSRFSTPQSDSAQPIAQPTSSAPSTSLSISDRLKALRKSRLEQQSSSGDTSKQTSVPLQNGNTDAASFATTPSNMSQGEYLLLTNRCRHLEKLVKSYERKMEEMQHTNSAALQADRQQHKSVDFAEAKETNPIQSLQYRPKPPTTSSTGSSSSSGGNAGSQSKAYSLPMPDNAEKTQRDAKTIQELAQEVKRLTTMLSRREITESETVSVTTSTGYQDAAEEDTDEIPVNVNASPAQQISSPNSRLNLWLQLLLSFLVGMLCVMLGVMLTSK